MLICTERSINPSKHHRQTIAVALKAKAASAQSCVEPNASVVVTTATQIVKKTRRPAIVWRLVCSRVVSPGLMGALSGSSTAGGVDGLSVPPASAGGGGDPLKI